MLSLLHSIGTTMSRFSTTSPPTHKGCPDCIRTLSEWLRDKDEQDPDDHLYLQKLKFYQLMDKVRSDFIRSPIERYHVDRAPWGLDAFHSLNRDWKDVVETLRLRYRLHRNGIWGNYPGLKSIPQTATELLELLQEHPVLYAQLTGPIDTSKSTTFCFEIETVILPHQYFPIARNYYIEWCTAHQVEDMSDDVIDTLAYVALMRIKNSGLPQESSKDYIFDEWDRYEFSQHF